MNQNKLLALNIDTNRAVNSVSSAIDCCEKIISSEFENYFAGFKRAINLYCALITNNPGLYDRKVLDNLLFNEKEIQLFILNIIKTINCELSSHAGRSYGEFKYCMDTSTLKPLYKYVEEAVKDIKEVKLIKKIAEKSINSMYKKAVSNLFPLPLVGKVLESRNIGGLLLDLLSEETAVYYSHQDSQLLNRLEGIVENINLSLYNDIHKSFMMFIYNEHNRIRKHGHLSDMHEKEYYAV